MKWLTYLIVGFKVIKQIIIAAEDGKITKEEVITIIEMFLDKLGISIISCKE